MTGAESVENVTMKREKAVEVYEQARNEVARSNMGQNEGHT